MAYKSILTVLTGGRLAGSAVEGAAEVTLRAEGHLEVLSLGVDVSAPGYYYAGANALIEQQSLERAREEAAQGAADAEAALKTRTLRWSVTSGVAQIGTIQHLVGTHSRFSDLVVLPKPYGAGREMADEAVIEAALFAGNVPVLVLPNGTAPPPFRKIVVAWNQSAEAMGAIRAALPFLQAAELTNIVIVDPPRHAADRSDPGGALSQMLARHGVKAEISVVAGTMPRTSDTLLRHASDQAADLLVMGAYGHSRFREAILGGATRDILEAADRAVFMHH